MAVSWPYRGRIVAIAILPISLNVITMIFLSFVDIILIINRANRFLDEHLRRLKRLPIGVAPSIFNSNADLWS